MPRADSRPLMGNRSSTKESEAAAAAASRAPDGALGTCKSILIGHTQTAGKPELIADLKRLRDTALGFMDGFQSSVNIQTIGIDYVRFPTPLPIDPRGAHLEYQCLDVSGQERFRGHPRLWYGTSSIILVYSVDNRESWDTLVSLSRSIFDPDNIGRTYIPPIILCATNTDLRPNCTTDSESWVLPIEEASLKNELFERVCECNRAFAKTCGHWDDAQDIWKVESALTISVDESALTNLGNPLCFLGDPTNPMSPAGAAVVQHIQVSSNMQNNIAMHRVCAVVGAMYKGLLDIEQGMFCLREEHKCLVYRNEGTSYAEDSWRIGPEDVQPFLNGRFGKFLRCCEMQQCVIMMIMCMRMPIPRHIRLHCLSYLQVCSWEFVWHSDVPAVIAPLSSCVLQLPKRTTTAEILDWCRKNKRDKYNTY